MINFKKIFFSVVIFSSSLIFSMQESLNLGDFENIPNEVLFKIFDYIFYLDPNAKSEKIDNWVKYTPDSYHDNEAIKFRNLTKILALRTVCKYFEKIIDTEHLNNLKIIKTLIKNKKSGLSLKLIYYVRENNLECAKKLVDCVDINKKGDGFSQTAIMIACENGNVDMVELLLKLKPDLSLKSGDYSKTALLYAYMKYEESKTNELKRTSQEEKLLAWYFKNNIRLEMKASKDYKKIILLLIDAGVDLRSKHYGFSIFEMAIKSGYFDIIEILVKHMRPHDLNRALKVVCSKSYNLKEEREKIIKLLKDNGAELKEENIEDKIKYYREDYKDNDTSDEQLRKLFKVSKSIESLRNDTF